ncbi:MAG: hypothetical protein Q7R35_19255 [Elusimicrobiota bacterium]|nr:hypothetical protein [Elusimicrobiota bacterium]
MTNSAQVILGPAAAQTVTYGAVGVQTILKMAAVPTAAPFVITDSGDAAKLTVSTGGVVTAKSFVNASQSISLTGGITTFGLNGSGVVLLTQTSGVNTIATIAGCDSGDVGQGQKVMFVTVDWVADSLTFSDTAVGGAADTMVLNGTAGHWAPTGADSSNGSSITLLCTTISATKVWVEVGRSVNTN